MGDFHHCLNVLDNGTGPRPFNDCGNRACMGSFCSNKIDFSSPHERFQEIGYNRDNRRNFLGALLYITIVIEMGVERESICWVIAPPSLGPKT